LGAGIGLKILPLGVQKTWQACQEKRFQGQLPLAVV
jgi:hypothetical protein